MKLGRLRISSHMLADIIGIEPGHELANVRVTDFGDFEFLIVGPSMPEKQPHEVIPEVNLTMWRREVEQPVKISRMECRWSLDINQPSWPHPFVRENKPMEAWPGIVGGGPLDAIDEESAA